MNLKLISFSLCPYVQRSVITLNYKKAKYEIEYIDLTNKPDWFLKLSPLGKVPILLVDGKVLFESAVINEFLDDSIGAPTLPRDPFNKAIQRAWIEYSSGLIADQRQTVFSQEPETLAQSYIEKLLRLEDVIDDSGFFNSEFSIVDSSYAPIFWRMQYFSFLWKHEKFINSKCQKWAQNLLSKEYVKSSVKKSFKDEMRQMLETKAPRAAGLMDL